MKRANIWTVSDTDRQNFPTDGNDLKRRLAAMKGGFQSNPATTTFNS